MTLPSPPDWIPLDATVARAAWNIVVARMMAQGYYEPYYATGTLCMVWQTYVRAVREGKLPGEREEWRVELRAWAENWLLVPEQEPHLKVVRADGLDSELVAAFGEPPVE